MLLQRPASDDDFAAATLPPPAPGTCME